jgi:hypothetical protein
LDATKAAAFDQLDTVMTVGAEKSQFALRCEKLPSAAAFASYLPASLFAHCATEHYYVAVLLCDAFVELSEYEKLPFVVGDTVDFRHLHTPKKVAQLGTFSPQKQQRLGQ